MGGKLTERLQRLHKPRVPAKTVTSEDQIFLAASEEQTPLPQEPNMAAAAAPTSSAHRPQEEQPPPAGPIGVALRRTYALRRKGGRSGSPYERSRAASDAPEATLRSSTAPPSVRGEAERLRSEIEHHLADGQPDLATPKLLALVAIYPDHPWGLSRLVSALEDQGDTVLARHFRARLQHVSPY